MLELPFIPSKSYRYGTDSPSAYCEFEPLMLPFCQSQCKSPNLGEPLAHWSMFTTIASSNVVVATSVKCAVSELRYTFTV